MLSFMAARTFYLVILAAWIATLWTGLDFAGRPKAPPTAVPATQVDWTPFFVANIMPSLPINEEFDTPLRPPDGNGVVISMPFKEQQHLGEDWTTAKGDDAMGEPVYSVGDGWVSVVRDFQGEWGKAVFVCYRLSDERYPRLVEVMYAQLDTTDVTNGQFVKRGQLIGTVGNVGGLYKAHLHWEVRDWIGQFGPGAAFDPKLDGHLGPTDFLYAHRGDRYKQPLLMRQLTPQELQTNEQASPKTQDVWGNDYN